ncbi:MAG: hypothetical protein V4560_13315 [Bacteroidota bacterium]
MQSNQTSSQQRGFFALMGLCAAKLEKPRAAILLSLLSHGLALQQKLANALTAAQGLLVFPSFARSFSADGDNHDTPHIVIAKNEAIST